MKRRDFLNTIFLALPISYSFGKNLFDNSKLFSTSKESILIFDKIIQSYLESPDKNYSSINKYIIYFAKQFLNYPYKAGTLEGEGDEICRLDMTGFDCVTFVETSLSLSRMIMKGYNSFESFVDEVIYTRYRNGELKDYTSRLHYTSDWIYDNIRKNVVEDLSKELGGIKFPLNVNFMSSHPEYYPPLRKNQAFIDRIIKIEKEINSRQYFYIPEDNVKEIEPFLRGGDIICIATNKTGLDYSHLGFAYIEESKKKKKARFIHASSKQKKVIIDKTISEYLGQSANSIGISVARPIEV